MTRRRTELLKAARKAMAHAHCPYSHFAVGAAVRLTDGTVVTGSNFENASYGLSLCAETVALAAVNAQGRLADVEAIAISGGTVEEAGVVSGRDVVTPCGRCRQVISEAEQVAGRTISIYCTSAEGNGAEDDGVEEYSLAELLPHAFSPAILQRNKAKDA